MYVVVITSGVISTTCTGATGILALADRSSRRQSREDSVTHFQGPIPTASLWPRHSARSACFAGVSDEAAGSKARDQGSKARVNHRRGAVGVEGLRAELAEGSV